jgi:hypothetical protein
VEAVKQVFFFLKRAKPSFAAPRLSGSFGECRRAAKVGTERRVWMAPALQEYFQ